MREFIESIFSEKDKIKFRYKDYNSLFIRGKYSMFYLFFFLQNESELVKLKDESAELYKTIKSSKDIYDIDMDKNVICIYCLCVEKEKYYDTEATGTISELSKKVCLVEEDLSFFKKNVLLYTDEMDKFANENIGKFDFLCRDIITESNFQNYKKSNIKNYRYDLLINLFIKLPFLNFQKYQLNTEKYKSVISFIEEKCNENNINKSYINKKMLMLEEKIDDENMFYKLLDELIEKESSDRLSSEVNQNEN